MVGFFTVGAIGAEGAEFFVGGFDEIVGGSLFDGLNEIGEEDFVGALLFFGIGEGEVLSGVFGKPIDHGDVLGWDLLAGEDGGVFGEEVAIEAGLDFLSKAIVTGWVLIGFPIVDSEGGVSVGLLDVDKIEFGDGGGVIDCAKEGIF